MPKKNRSKPTPLKPLPRRPGTIRRESNESSAAEALTVAWMLSVMTTLACEVGAVLLHWYFSRTEEVKSTAAEALTTLLQFAALIIGLVALVLVPIVYRLRREPPPMPVTAFAVIVGAAPLAVMLVQSLLRE